MKQALERDLGDAELPEPLKATLTFLEKLTLTPSEIDEDDVEQVIATGVTPRALRDAIEVAAAFNVIDRIADALEFEPQSPDALKVSAQMLSTRGYA